MEKLICEGMKRSKAAGVNIRDGESLGDIDSAKRLEVKKGRFVWIELRAP